MRTLNKQEVENMKAAILAAGQGLRLAQTNPSFAYLPKCLLKIGRKTVLEHQIEVLKQFKVTDVSIVVGVKGSCWNNVSHKLIKAICEKEKIKMVLNNENDRTQNAYSLFLAVNNMECDQLLSTDSDMFFTKEILSSVLNDPHENVILCYRTNDPSISGTRVLVDQNGLVKAIGKTWEIPLPASSWLMHNGIIKIDASFFVQFKRILISCLEKDRHKDSSYPLRKYSKEHGLYALEINHGHVNINTQHDLQNATRMLEESKEFRKERI